jgi:hypothetical protein
MRGLLQDLGNDHMGNLRSKSDGRPVSGPVKGPESDGVSRCAGEPVGGPDTRYHGRSEGDFVGDPVGDWGTHMGVIPGMALFAS